MKNCKFMTTSRILIVLTGLMVLLSTPVKTVQAAAPDKPLDPGVIDDFKDAKPNPWEFITDKVMGGDSTGKMEFVTHEDRPSLHLTGSVSSKKTNNFIQVRRPVDPKKKYFDASDYDGLRLKVKGNSGTYAVHFKTSSTLFPWQHYQAEFKTVHGWQEVIIPFKDFKPQSLSRAIKTSKLKTIGIVAMTKEMKVDLYVHEIAFYKKGDLKDTSPETR